VNGASSSTGLTNRFRAQKAILCSTASQLLAAPKTQSLINNSIVPVRTRCRLGLMSLGPSEPRRKLPPLRLSDTMQPHGAPQSDGPGGFTAAFRAALEGRITPRKPRTVCRPLWAMPAPSITRSRASLDSHQRFTPPKLHHRPASSSPSATHNPVFFPFTPKPQTAFHPPNSSPAPNRTSIQKFTPPKLHPPEFSTPNSSQPHPSSKPTYTDAKSFTAPLILYFVL
jgi:hypothetical protein